MRRRYGLALAVPGTGLLVASAVAAVWATPVAGRGAAVLRRSVIAAARCASADRHCGSGRTAARRSAPSRQAPGWLLAQARRMVVGWRFLQGGPLLSVLPLLYPQDPRVVALLGRWFYLQGDYVEARRWISRMGADDLRQEPLAAQTAAALRQVRGYAEQVSPSGNFVLRYPPGIDALLVDPAFETLERARTRLGRDWGLALQGPVRVEVLPGPSALAAVSTLTEDEVRRTGTIALCADHKIWLVTPRALVTGYAWRDTLGHELIHFLLESQARHRVPLWLHEGLARYGQARWRGPFPIALSPAEEHLLAEARAARALVPISRMSPSFAKLRDGREAALAFAEVASMVLHLVKRSGQAGVGRLVRALAAGRDVDSAFQRATGIPMAGFLASWRRALGRARLTQISGFRPSWRRYRSSGGSAHSPRDAALPTGPVARQRRLGALLRSRGFLQAAAVAYRRAFLASHDASGAVGNTLARLLLRLGRPAEALQVAERALRLHPDTAALHIAKARAAERLGELQQARRALERAGAVDPFDPEVHCRLARIGPDATRRAREARWCRRLGGSPVASPGAAAPARRVRVPAALDRPVTRAPRQAKSAVAAPPR